MATTSISLPIFLLFALSLSIFYTHATADDCSSQSFSGNRVYSLCSDLDDLDATLHWTYHASNSSLSLAFVAPPPKSNGWIAWAINPKAKGMVGSQALIAFHLPNGSMTVETFNITAYGPIQPSPIDFNVSNTASEYSSGTMKIFAVVSLPSKTTTFNQVWQVGAGVNGTSPEKHAFEKENLNAKGTLDLLKGETGSNSTASSSSNTTTTGSGNGSSSSRLSFSLLSLFIFSYSVFVTW